MIKMKTNVTPGETPEKITVSMIDQDLKDGISKSEMAIKYGIKPWEVDEIFKHPFLKGRRPSRKKALSFTFVDDITSEHQASPLTTTVRPDEVEEEFVDPNQITLEQAIDDAIEGVEEVKNQMQETQEAIIDMLSPTQFETPEETIAKVNSPEITGIPNGDTMSDTDDDELEIPSFEDTLDLVKEQQEEELEMDDDTFEL